MLRLEVFYLLVRCEKRRAGLAEESDAGELIEDDADVEVQKTEGADHDEGHKVKEGSRVCHVSRLSVLLGNRHSVHQDIVVAILGNSNEQRQQGVANIVEMKGRIGPLALDLAFFRMPEGPHAFPLEFNGIVVAPLGKGWMVERAVPGLPVEAAGE